MRKSQGVGLIALGIFALLVWAVLRYLWIIGIFLMILGLIVLLAGKK